MNKMIAVDKSVPMPERKAGKNVGMNYPYEQMDVGDSFHVEGVNLQVVLNANYRAGKQLGMKFIARKDDKGIRVWRIS